MFMLCSVCCLQSKDETECKASGSTDSHVDSGDNFEVANVLSSIQSDLFSRSDFFFSQKLLEFFKRRIIKKKSSKKKEGITYHCGRKAFDEANKTKYSIHLITVFVFIPLQGKANGNRPNSSTTKSA